MTDGATPEPATGQRHAYELFILVLTVLSLAIMVVLLLPVSEATIQLLIVYDNAICVIFLVDFAWNLAKSDPKRDYFVGRRGWLDLIGSLPTLGIFRFTALFRLARLSRLARIARLLSGSNRRELVDDLIRNRGQYASFITVLAAFVVLCVSSILVLQVESGATEANIEDGGDALWWAFVTITTVGYGDQFPVTLAGRLIGVFVMFAGVGIIASLASILASVLVPSPKPELDAGDEAATSTAVRDELREIKGEIAQLRRMYGGDGRGSGSEREGSAGADG